MESVVTIGVRVEKIVKSYGLRRKKLFISGAIDDKVNTELL